MEQRVARVKDLLDRIDRRLSGIEKDLSVLPTITDHAALKADIAELKGRLSGLDHRLASRPTVWTIPSITFTTWALGSGILIAASKNLR
ncbi:DUF2730 family protein [Rhodoplanes azumiensis]|uniref:DUF2730 family protein n=1 Tax=Rhodoplanes azumiensis TaxID=1897628 RepID=A0ABW5AJR6_9BRAD